MKSQLSSVYLVAYLLNIDWKLLAIIFVPFVYFWFPDHHNKNPAESVNSINSNYTFDTQGLNTKCMERLVMEEQVMLLNTEHMCGSRKLGL